MYLVVYFHQRRSAQQFLSRQASPNQDHNTYMEPFLSKLAARADTIHAEWRLGTQGDPGLAP